MTDQQLQAIKERVAAATPGEWEVRNDNEGTEYRPFYVISEVDADSGEWFAEVHVGCEQDAQFIAHARQDIPVLVAEVERLRKEVHGHEQSLLHDTYSEFTAKREIKQLRQTLAAVNETIGTYLKMYHYPVYEQMAKALEEGEGNEFGIS